LRGNHQLQWSEFDKLTFNINQVSDLDYPKDFTDEFPNYANSGLENRVNYTARSDISTTSLTAIYYKHLLSANSLADNSMAVHQLPEIKFDTTINQISNTPLFYKFGLTYTNFYRQKKYDDISLFGTQRYASNNSLGANPAQCEHNLNLGDGYCSLREDGTYDPAQDIIRSGQRLNYSASLLTPSYTALDSISLSPELSYHETHYLFPVGDDEYKAQRYLEFDVLSRSKLYRIFEGLDSKYKHEFIPELSYRWIPWYQHDKHPFFGADADGEIPVVSRNIISDDDLKNDNKIQFDYEDRIYDRNLITLNLINRVVEKNNASGLYKNIFDIQIRQSYDIYQSYNGKNKNEPLSDLSSTANLYLSEYTLSNQTNYYPYQAATNSSTTLTYINSLQQYIKLGYSSKQTGGPKQDDVSISLGFVTAYLNLLTGVVLDTSENRQSDSRIKKVSLITQIKPPGECWAINLYRNQKVGSEAEWKLGFDMSWDGKPTKVIPPQELNIN
jgi:LPS-assembly protein